MNLKFMILTLTGLLFFFGNAVSETCTSDSSGDWDDNSNWTCDDGSDNPTDNNDVDVVIEDPDDITLNVNAEVNDLTIESDASLTADGNDITVKGDWSSPGTFDEGSAGRVIFQGGSQQNFSSGGAAEDFYEFELDNSDGLFLNDEFEVNEELILEEGIIEDRTNDYKVILERNVRASGTDQNSFVDGQVEKKFANEVQRISNIFTYPIGEGNTLGKLSVYGKNLNNDEIAVEYKKDTPPQENSLGGDLLNISDQEYWALTGTGGRNNLTIRLHWTDQSASGIDNTTSSDPELAAINENDGSPQWDDEGQDDKENADPTLDRLRALREKMVRQ